MALSTREHGNRVTYSAATFGLVPAASATDVFTIAGSATKTVRITKVEFSGTAGAAISVSAQLIKRSAADTGGTSGAVTAIPHDSADPAATATVLSYTANPAGLGATVGAVRCVRTTLPVGGAVGSSVSLAFGDQASKPVVLRGTAELLALNLGAASITTGNLNVSVEWTES